MPLQVESIPTPLTAVQQVIETHASTSQSEAWSVCLRCSSISRLLRGPPRSQESRERSAARPSLSGGIGWTPCLEALATIAQPSPVIILHAKPLPSEHIMHITATETGSTYKFGQTSRNCRSFVCWIEAFYIHMPNFMIWSYQALLNACMRYEDTSDAMVAFDLMRYNIYK